ncbi:MAG TPA: hypothetical protein VHD58_09420 [Mycobacteriales bacterium]|nr:hypothetical protein [Mycobacteriales bacterium]
MDKRDVALFLHVGVVIIGFMIAAVLHASLHSMVRAQSAEQARPFAALVHRLEPLFPIVALLILGFGAWLIHLEKGFVDWGDGWILTSLITLIVIEGLSGTLLAPRSKKLISAIDAAPNGPMSAELRRQASDPMIWDLAHIGTLGFLGVVFVMVSKPSGGVSVVLVVVGVIVGVLLSRWQLALAAKATGTASASGAGASSPATP